jgi:hypothetical protein
MLGLDGNRAARLRRQSRSRQARRGSRHRAHVLCRILQEGAASDGKPANHLPLQRRPWLVDDVAAHGLLWPAPRGHSDTVHEAAAPYKIANNDSSLLDVSDLVFIDAPGTGFSRVFGKDKEKAFYRHR